VSTFVVFNRIPTYIQGKTETTIFSNPPDGVCVVGGIFVGNNSAQGISIMVNLNNALFTSPYTLFTNVGLSGYSSLDLLSSTITMTVGDSLSIVSQSSTASYTTLVSYRQITG